VTPSPAIDRKGLFAAIGAYVIWGVFPIYWYWLRDVPSLQIISHRIVWCAVFVVGWLLLSDGLRWLQPLRARPRVLGLLLVTSVLISANWGIYIWAVTHGRVVDASLGYFINPLVNVLLAVLVLRERLTATQWTAVAIAAAGVLWLAFLHGEPPWIALALATTFAAYGLIRKLAHVDAVPGLAVESLVLLLPALAWLTLAEAGGRGAFGHGDGLREAMLVFGGALTALPLVGFAYGAKRIPYSLVGFLQYISPTLQLLTGVLLLGEAFVATEAVGFACIWLALALYAFDGWRRARQQPQQAAAEHCDADVPVLDGGAAPKEDPAPSRGA